MGLLKKHRSPRISTETVNFVCTQIAVRLFRVDCIDCEARDSRCKAGFNVSFADGASRSSASECERLRFKLGGDG